MNELICSETQEVVDSDDWFKLKINNPEAASPAFEYAWCLGPKLNKKLLEANVAYPYLVTVVYKVYKDGSHRLEHKEISKLDQGINMLPFELAGDYRIFCLVAWYNGEPTAEVEYEELAESQVSLATGHFEYPDKTMSIKASKEYDNVEFLPFQFRADFSIDAKQFEPAPPKWLDDWVCLFGDRPKTLVGWWLKCLFSFTLQPIIVFIGLLFAYAVTVFVLLGFIVFGVRPWQIKYLDAIKLGIHDPPTENFSHFFAMHTDKSFLMQAVWWHHKSDEEKRPLFDRSMLCQPFWLVLVFVLVWSLGPGIEHGILEFLWVFAKWFIAVMLFNYLLCKLRTYVSSLLKSEEKARRAMAKKKDKIRKRIEKYYPEKLEPLACSSLKSFKDIATKKASLVHKLKAKLYRPLAKL